MSGLDKSTLDKVYDVILYDDKLYKPNKRYMYISIFGSAP